MKRWIALLLTLGAVSGAFAAPKRKTTTTLPRSTMPTPCQVADVAKITVGPGVTLRCTCVDPEHWECGQTPPSQDPVDRQPPQ